MATSLGTQTVRNAAPYWLEQIPYTTTIGSLAAGASESVFTLQGWNNPADPGRMLVRLDHVALAPVPGIQVLIRADTEQEQYDAPTFPDGLAPCPVQATAFKNLSLTVINRGTTTVSNLVVRYQITIWRDPIAAKLLYGQSLTAADASLLKTAFKLTPQQFLGRGHVPLDIEDIIRTSYQNRVVRAVTPYALTTTVSSSAPTTLPPVIARPQQLLVLRHVAMDARYGDGVTLTVDRDTDTSEVVIPALPTDSARPVALFLPALSQLAFSLSATTTPATGIPVRLTVWRVALSDILTMRMGLVTQADLAATEGEAAAFQVASRTAAGVL